MSFVWSFHLLAQDGLSIPQQHDILELVKGSGLLVQLVLLLADCVFDSELGHHLLQIQTGEKSKEGVGGIYRNFLGSAQSIIYSRRQSGVEGESRGAGISRWL